MTLRTTGLLLTLSLGVLSAPIVTDAQQTGRPYQIGVLHEGYFPSIPQVEGLKAGLKATGLEEGRDVTFDIRFTRGNPQAASVAAAALVKAGVDLIFTADEEATRAGKAATQTIPIVFTGVGDPVAAGIVASVAHPGGNVTGVSNLATELVPKQLEILKAIVPTLRRVWAVYHADDRSAEAGARLCPAGPHRENGSAGGLTGEGGPPLLLGHLVTGLPGGVAFRQQALHRPSKEGV